MQNIKHFLKDTKTDVAFIPGGLTSMVQPLDVSVNKPFKDVDVPTGKIKRPYRINVPVDLEILKYICIYNGKTFQDVHCKRCLLYTSRCV